MPAWPDACMSDAMVHQAERPARRAARDSSSAAVARNTRTSLDHAPAFLSQVPRPNFPFVDPATDFDFKDAPLRSQNALLSASLCIGNLSITVQVLRAQGASDVQKLRHRFVFVH